MLICPSAVSSLLDAGSYSSRDAVFVSTGSSVKKGISGCSRAFAKFGLVDDFDAEFAGFVELGAGFGPGDEAASGSYRSVFTPKSAQNTGSDSTLMP
jgi:hypothetical protein